MKLIWSSMSWIHPCPWLLIGGMRQKEVKLESLKAKKEISQSLEGFRNSFRVTLLLQGQWRNGKRMATTGANYCRSFFFFEKILNIGKAKKEVRSEDWKRAILRRSHGEYWGIHKEKWTSRHKSCKKATKTNKKTAHRSKITRTPLFILSILLDDIILNCSLK